MSHVESVHGCSSMEDDKLVVTFEDLPENIIELICQHLLNIGGQGFNSVLSLRAASCYLYHLINQTPLKIKKTIKFKGFTKEEDRSLQWCNYLVDNTDWVLRQVSIMEDDDNNHQYKVNIELSYCSFISDLLLPLPFSKTITDVCFMQNRHSALIDISQIIDCLCELENLKRLRLHIREAIISDDNVEQILPLLHLKLSGKVFANDRLLTGHLLLTCPYLQYLELPSDVCIRKNPAIFFSLFNLRELRLGETSVLNNLEVLSLSEEPLFPNVTTLSVKLSKDRDEVFSAFISRHFPQLVNLTINLTLQVKNLILFSRRIQTFKFDQDDYFIDLQLFENVQKWFITVNSAYEFARSLEELKNPNFKLKYLNFYFPYFRFENFYEVFYLDYALKILLYQSSLQVLTIQFSKDIKSKFNSDKITKWIKDCQPLILAHKNLVLFRFGDYNVDKKFAVSRDVLDEVNYLDSHLGWCLRSVI